MVYGNAQPISKNIVELKSRKYKGSETDVQADRVPTRLAIPVKMPLERAGDGGAYSGYNRTSLDMVKYTK